MEEKKIRLIKENYKLVMDKLDQLPKFKDVNELKDLFEEEKDYMEIPFDFDKAKNGDLSIKTRSGYDVRIICWDRLGEYPIVGLVKRNEETENVMLFDRFGLPMAAPVETECLVCLVKKRKIWVSVYLDENGYVQVAVPADVDSRYKVLATVQVNYFPK